MSGWDWDVIYLTCFGVGLVLSLVSFFGGMMHLHIGNFRMHLHMKSTGHRGAGHMSPLNGFTLMAFLCWFGGTGYLLHRAHVFGALLVMVFSVLSGLAGGGLVFWFLVGVLLPGEKLLTAEETEIVGVTGTLSCAVRKGGVGEMLYAQNGARRSAPVRSDDGEAIERGAEVIVMRYAKGVAYVRRWDEFEHGLMAGSSAAERE